MNKKKFKSIFNANNSETMNPFGMENAVENTIASGRRSTDGSADSNDIENDDTVLLDGGEAMHNNVPPSFGENVHSLPTVAGLTGTREIDDNGSGKREIWRGRRTLPTKKKRVLSGIGGCLVVSMLVLLGIIIAFGESSNGGKNKKGPGSSLVMMNDEGEEFGTLLNEGEALYEKKATDIMNQIEKETQESLQEIEQQIIPHGTPEDLFPHETEAGLGDALYFQSELHNRIGDISLYLVHEGISEETDLLRTFTPQHAALQWMADQDTRKMDIPTADVRTKDGYDFVVRYILAVVYYSLGGTFWTDQLNFLSSDHICEWSNIVLSEYGTFARGVACDKNDVIEALFLDSNNLESMLPDELGFLTTLSILNLDLNIISGYIPDTFSQLIVLEHLSMAHNKLSGNLPQDVDRMTSLQSMDLSYNYIDGELPASVSKFSSLRAIAIDNNIISGSIGDIFKTAGNHFLKNDGLEGGLLDVEFLYAEDNNFTDVIDDTFLTGLHTLLRLDISGNILQGTLPAHLFEMPMLEVLDLHDNFITGTLPPMSQSNTQLKFMALQKNQLKGTIPPLITFFSELFHLDLSDNQLTGTITASIAALHKLNSLVVAKNSFTPGPIPDFLRQLTGLKDLSLKGTNRNGTLPDFLGDLKQLVLLDLDDNQLVGSIPDSFAEMESIQFVLLNGNKLTGTIPDFFFDFKFLRMLFVDSNDFTGDNLENMFCNNNENEFLPIIVADCVAEVQCECCFKCCTDNEPCNDDDMVPSNDPTWQFGYQRLFYTFGQRNSFFAN